MRPGGKESAMRHRGFPAFFLTMMFVAFSAASAWAAPAEFAVTAANVTMPSSGNGSSPYTVTGIPITGTLAVTCKYSGPATTANIPDCSYGPIAATPVTAGETVTGTISFFPFGVAVPQEANRTSHAPVPLALAGALLLGFRLRRLARGWLVPMVLAVGSLAAVAALSGCVASMNGMTPGTYQYTIAAGNSGTLNPLVAEATTTIDVTVP
jgi:hypothetical protein